MQRLLVLVIIISSFAVLYCQEALASSNKETSLDAPVNSIFSQSTSNNDYFVSEDGNDLNDGRSISSPWKTLNRVNSFAFSPGDRIFFRKGDEWRESLLIDESGTDEAMITFAAYGTGANPVFNQADIVTGWTHITSNVWMANCPVIDNSNGIPHDYVAVLDGDLLMQVETVYGLTTPGTYYIDTSPSPDRICVYSQTDPDNRIAEVSARKFGIGVLNERCIRIQNLNLKYAGHSGAFFHSEIETGQLNGNCLIEDCIFYGNRISGIIFDNGYSGNHVQNCTSTYNGNGYYCSSYQSYGSDRNTFSFCYSANNINYKAGVVSDGHGFGIWNSNDNIVEHCESFNDKYGINIDPNNRRNDIVIRYNYVHDTQPGTPGINVGGNVPSGTLHYVYGNLIVNPGEGGDGYAIWAYGTERQGSVYILNNTIYLDGKSNHSSFALYLTIGTNVILKNNIIFSNSSNTTLLNVNGNTSLTCDYNLYYSPFDQTNILRFNGRNYHSLSEWKTATGLDSHSIYGDPLFKNVSGNYDLKEGSPAINSGSLSGLEYDFNQNPINGAPDIGAFEYQSEPIVQNPVLLSSSVENANPNVIELNFDLDLDDIVPSSTCFIVKVNSAAQSVNLLRITGKKILLTLSGIISFGDLITVEYIKPSSNPLQSTQGGEVESFPEHSVTNRVAAPEIPVFQESSVENNNTSRIEISFNLSLANITPSVNSFSAKVNSSIRSVSSISVSGNKVLLILSAPVIYGDIITISYTQPSLNPLQASGGGKVLSFIDKVVNNKISAPEVPGYLASSIEESNPSLIIILFNLPLANITPSPVAFTARVNSSQRDINAVSVSGSNIFLTMSSPVVYNDKITITYTKPSANPLQSISGGQALSFTAQEVSNNLIMKNVPPVVVLKYNKKCFSGFVSALDAGDSYDENSDKLTFTWETPENIPVSSISDPVIEFLAPIVSEPSLFQFKTNVSDGKTTKSEIISLEIHPYRPELESAEISRISASSFVDNDYPYNIADNDFNTFWSSTGLNEFLIIELRKPFSVIYFTLAMKPDPQGELRFDILGSNDKSTWDPIITKSEPCSFSGKTQVIEASPSKAGKEYKYIKLIRTGGGSGTKSSVSEIEIRGYPGSSSISFEKSPVKIYPNPASQFIRIKIDEPSFKADMVNIYDLSGRLITTYHADLIPDEYLIPLNLINGTYLIRFVKNGQLLTSRKLIVVK